MSDDLQTGLNNAITEILEGIVLSAILGIIPAIPNVPSYYVGIIQLIEVLYLVAGILIILAMESWKFWYLVGWLFGMMIMSTAGLIEPWLFIFYVAVGIPVLIIKAFRKVSSYM